MSTESDWTVFLRNVVTACDEAAPLLGHRCLTGSKYWGGVKYEQTFFGSSNEFNKFVRNQYPRYMVPEHDIVPILGSKPWTPKSEEPSATGPCPQCGDRIENGSILYCPKCQGSGYEHALNQQRKLAGLPQPEPSVPDVQPVRANPESTSQGLSRHVGKRQLTRHERRALKFQKPDGGLEKGPASDAENEVARATPVEHTHPDGDGARSPGADGSAAT